MPTAAVVIDLAEHRRRRSAVAPRAATGATPLPMAWVPCLIFVPVAFPGYWG